MENKTARFTVLMDPLKKQAFEQLCAAQDLTPSQVTRQLIREYLEKHDVSFGDNQSRLVDQLVYHPRVVNL